MALCDNLCHITRSTVWCVALVHDMCVSTAAGVKWKCSTVGMRHLQVSSANTRIVHLLVSGGWSACLQLRRTCVVEKQTRCRPLMCDVTSWWYRNRRHLPHKLAQ